MPTDNSNLEYDNVIIIHDFTLHFTIIKVEYDVKKQLDISLGVEKFLIDPDIDGMKSNKIIESKNQPLFEPSKVNPIILGDISSETVVVLNIRPEHLLVNTVFSSNNFFNEVFYSSKGNNLVYLFWGFTANSSLQIRSSILEDTNGILEYFKKNLTDNHVRKLILDCLYLPSIPINFLNDLLLKRADNSIIYKGNIFIIKYKGIEIMLKDSKPLRDLLYIIYNKTNTSDIASFWLWQRKKETFSDNLKSIDTILRATNRLLTDIRLIEHGMEIPKDGCFSEFVKTYIKIEPATLSISYKAPKGFIWAFALPNEFNN